MLECILEFIWLLLTIVTADHWAQRVLEDMFLHSTVKGLFKHFHGQHMKGKCADSNATTNSKLKLLFACLAPRENV